MSLIYGISLLFTGFGSFVFHAHGGEISETIETSAIYIQLFVLIGFSVLLLVEFYSEKAFIIKLVLFILGLALSVPLATLSFTQVIERPTADAIFGLLIGITLILIFFAVFLRIIMKNPMSWQCIRYLGFSCLCFFVGAFFQEEIIPIKCNDETAILQAHGFWHVLAGCGFFLLYLFFRADGYDEDVSEMESEYEEPERLRFTV